MSYSLEAVRDLSEAANVNYDVQCALHDIDTWTNSIDHNVPRWSPLMNAYNSACTVLNKNPFEPLTPEVISVPDDINFLGRQVLGLINGSLERYGKPSGIDHTSHNSRFEDTCVQSEYRFMKALGHTSAGEIVPQPSLNYLYLDENDEAILFTKGRGCEATISFKDVSVNGVVYPPGVLFSVVVNPDARRIEENYATITHREDSIKDIQPVRMSLFAVPPEERFETVFTPMQQKLVSKENDGELDQKRLDLTVDELGSHIIRRSVALA